ncbi:MAG: thioredoxin family protein, partial [Ferruginibacter sp.]
MKKLLFYFAFSFITLTGHCQGKPGIDFVDSNWKELLAKAKSENKLIFMDAFTTWCGPCKMMAKNVFPDRQVSALYNRNFINVAMDMEKGEGIVLKDQYKVNAYPTYLFINGDGKIIHKFVGEHSIEQFIQSGLDALSPVRNLSYYEKNYRAKKNDYDFIAGYLDVLQNAYEEAVTNKVALDYLSEVKASKLEDGGNWDLIENYLYDASSAPFQYVVNHQGQFEKLYGNEKVDKKIYNTYLMWPRNYLHYSSEGKLNFDQKGFDHFLSLLEKSNYIKKED